MGRAQDTTVRPATPPRASADTARDAAGSVVEGARRAPDKVIEQTQGNPIAAGLIAFGGGLLVASLIPPSEAEQRVAGQVVEKAQPLRDELQRAGQEVVEDLRSTAEQGAEQVKQRAAEAAGTVQEDVRVFGRQRHGGGPALTSPRPGAAPYLASHRSREATEMSFNPLEQTGIPVEDQFRNWSELNVTPYDKRTVDPYTRTRVILMNGIEVESIMFSHQFARHTDHPDLKRALATNRRVDAQQQKAVNGLNPGDQSPLETTIGYEQVAVDLTAWLARHEPDPMVHQALDFALLEDFDHLYRYGDLYDLLYGGRADEITQHLTEITPGRPTVAEHRHPHDEVRTHFETHTVDPLTRMHVMTIVAAEQQTMNFYMNHGTDWIEPIARGLYAEIALDRGAARHPLRVAARPARLVARACGCSTSTTRSTCTGRCCSTRATGASRRCGSST